MTSYVKWCTVRSEGTWVSSEPFQLFSSEPASKGMSNHWLWPLAFILLFSGSGCILSLIFRVTLNWPISIFLSDLVPVLFSSKKASGLQFYSIVTKFLTMGTLHYYYYYYYYLLIYLFIENSHILWVSLEPSTFLKKTLKFWSSCTHLPSVRIIE